MFDMVDDTKKISVFETEQNAVNDFFAHICFFLCVLCLVSGLEILV